MRFFTPPIGSMARYIKKRTSRKKPLKAAKFSKVKRDALVKKMRQIASTVVNRNIETKTSQETSTDGTQIFHNNIVTLTSNLLQTTQGTGDKEVGIGDRIGDRVNLKGVSLKFFLELNERYSDVTFRIMVVKSARNDFPSRATLFNGESGNKMMDTINKERYTVLAQKFTKIRAPNQGIADGTGNTINVEPVVGDPSGIYTAATAADRDRMVISRATRMIKMWIPGHKFVRGGNLIYEDAVNKPKFFEYSVVIFAYSNYSTDQDVWYVGRVNEFLSKMYYKDA